MPVRDKLWGKKGPTAPAEAVREPDIREEETPGFGAKDRLALLDAFESSGIGWFWAADALNHIIYLSDSAAEKFGEGAAVQGVPLTDLVGTADESGEFGGERPLNFFLNSQTKFRDLTVRLHCGGRNAWWLLNGQPHFDDEGNYLGFRGSAKDITEQFIRSREESQLAQFDTLTGLANRHRMERRLEATLSSFNAAKRSCALLMMDLDKFKAVNDTLGHPAGDELLRQVSQRLQRIVGAPAEIGRLGGDEFQFIIPDIDDRGHLGELAQKIIQMVSQPYSLGDDRAVIGASIGIAIAPYDGVTPDELVKSADLALYASKDGGRGRYRFYANDLANAARKQKEIGEELREALRSGQLEMHYQPIVSHADNKVVSFEALMRWDHPELGSIEPAVFIPVAEEMNIMNQLGEWAIKQACEDACKWPGDIRLSVNISVQQFFSGLLPSTIRDALEQTGLRASRLELEITEGVFMGEGSAVDAMFANLTKLGVHLSLDDFGTGYSSLTYLRRAPFEKIKIDQSFVHDCCEQGNTNAAIITAIIGLAHALEMKTTAEGVEALDELGKVRALGAEYIQGFIFSRPVPQAEIMRKLATGDFVYDPAGPDKQRSDRRTVFRQIGVVHEDQRYEAVLRNLSRTGALIEGLLDVPVGTDLVLDLGDGQLAVATVRRSQDATQGLEFETPLISDGASGLCTRHRVSPHQLAAAGMPLTSLAKDAGMQFQHRSKGKPRFKQVDLSATSSRAA